MANNEIFANLFYAISVVLAARNSVHTWWTGIIGCTLFSWVFYDAKLYADVALMQFYIGTSLYGWWNWLHGRQGSALTIARTPPAHLFTFLFAALLVTGGYGGLLHALTDAYAPFIDSAIMAFSVLAQLLLMQRRIENWGCWILVNTLAAPLYYSRDLHLTAALYTLFWFNAWWGLYRWHKALSCSHKAPATP